MARDAVFFTSISFFLSLDPIVTFHFSRMAMGFFIEWNPKPLKFFYLFQCLFLFMLLQLMPSVTEAIFQTNPLIVMFESILFQSRTWGCIELNFLWLGAYIFSFLILIFWVIMYIELIHHIHSNCSEIRRNQSCLYRGTVEWNQTNLGTNFQRIILCKFGRSHQSTY